MRLGNLLPTEEDVGILEEKLHDRVDVEARLLCARDDSLREARDALRVEACPILRMFALQRYYDACKQWGEAREKREQAHQAWLRQFNRRAFIASL